jgi:mannose-6-phosphate isomerase class I
MTGPIPLHRVASRSSNYDKFPFVPVGSRADCAVGWDAVCAAVRQTERRVIVVEAYTGVRDDDLVRLVAGIGSELSVNAARALKPEEEINRMVQPDVTEDPVFGRRTKLRLEDFFDGWRVRLLQEAIEKTTGGVVVYGIGASLLARGDLLIYADMPRREEELRQRRSETANLGASNFGEVAALKYKRSFFVDWVVCNEYRRSLFEKADFVLDTSTPEPKMISSRSLKSALEAVARRPFRVVPWFDPAPWGGHWLMEVCDLDRDESNYGWAFDCVPQENTLLLGFGGILFQTPAMNAVLQAPTELLGTEIVDRFGAEFPIRFDFLDTMEGGNLSLQVHPPADYIHARFGMPYTQHESYYVVDADRTASVFLGLKADIDRKAMISDLRRAASEAWRFPEERYVNRFPAARHDHFLIPAGTVHCSGEGTVVLEISATPYLFTFKLWDWDRLDLDGRPRPLHLDHGERCIEWQRDRSFVEANLINRVRRLAEGDGWQEERTGLSAWDFIETRRHWFTKPVAHDTDGRVNVLNLVQGEEAVVESPEGGFEPFVIHFAESFIVPAQVGPYTIRPAASSSGRCATIKAFVGARSVA